MWLLLLTLVSPLAATPPERPTPLAPELTRADTLFAEFKYAEALKVLTALLGAPGLDRPTLLHVLELEGVSAGQLRQTALAQKAFRELLTLDPGHKLAVEYAPRVTTPFLEAGQQVAEAGALEGTASATVKESAVESVLVTVKDPLGLVRAVRFHVRRGAEWVTTKLPLLKGVATQSVSGAEVWWWAELLGEGDSQLLLLGSAEASRQDKIQPVAVVAPPSVVETHATVTASTSGLRVASYVVLGAAALAVAAGAVMGARSAADFSTVQNATRDAQGRVTSLTEREAVSLNASGRQNAQFANGLFIGSAALAMTGALLWWLGAPVVITPTGSGVAVSLR